MSNHSNQKMSECEFQKYLEGEVQKMKQREIDFDKLKQLHIIVDENNDNISHKQDNQSDTNIDNKDVQKCINELLNLSNNFKKDSNNAEFSEMLNLLNSVNILNGNTGLNGNIYKHMLNNFMGSNSKEIFNIVINYINSNINVYKMGYNTFNANNIIYENFDEVNINKGGKIVLSNHINLSDSFLILNKIKNSTVIIASIEAINKLLKYFNLKNTIIEDNFIDLFNIIYYDPDKNGNGNDVKNEMLKLVNENKNILLFPEGGYGRSYTKINQFKLGGLKLAYDNKIPVVPIVLYYSNKKLAKVK